MFGDLFQTRSYWKIDFLISRSSSARQVMFLWEQLAGGHGEMIREKEMNSDNESHNGNQQLVFWGKQSPSGGEF